MNKLEKYFEARPFIKTGDLLLYSGKSLISEGIKLVTDSEYSHIEMVLDFKDVFVLDRKFTIGALNRGIEIHSISSRVKNYEGKIDVYRCTKIEKAESIRLIREALKILDTPYGYDNIKDIVVDKLFKKKKYNPDDSPEQTEKFICSEAVSYLYRKIGIDLCPEKADEVTYPGDCIKNCTKIFNIL